MDDLITRRTSIAALTALAFAVARACHSTRSAAESSLHVQEGLGLTRATCAKADNNKQLYVSRNADRCKHNTLCICVAPRP